MVDEAFGKETWEDLNSFDPHLTFSCAEKYFENVKTPLYDLIEFKVDFLVDLTHRM